MLGRKSLRKILQSIGSDLRLMLENEVAELTAQLLRLRIEVARDDGRIERPIVHRQREVVPHQRDFVRLRGLLFQR